MKIKLDIFQPLPSSFACIAAQMLSPGCSSDTLQCIVYSTALSLPSLIPFFFLLHSMLCIRGDLIAFVRLPPCLFYVFAYR